MSRPFYIYESATLQVLNPFKEDYQKPFAESAIGDLKLTDVRSVFPFIRAISSDKVTKNWTYYPASELKGSKDPADPTGFYSFVKPYGVPVIREHRLHDSGGIFGDGTEAEIPMGRVLWSTYKKYGPNDPQTAPKKSYIPGTLEGSGYLGLVASITQEEAINRVLSHQYHTVSIGSTVDTVIESISGVDLIAARNKGEERPKFDRGQVYKIDKEEKLSYWILGGLRAAEISYVNSPSDVQAATITADIGLEAVQLLLGEKKTGSKEFTFWDPVTKEKVDFSSFDEFAFDESIDLVDSIRVGKDTWIVSLEAQKKAEELITESVKDLTNYGVGDFIQIEKEGKIVNGYITGVFTEGLPLIAAQTSNGIEGSEENPAYRIRIFQSLQEKWTSTDEEILCLRSEVKGVSVDWIKPILRKVMDQIMENMLADTAPVADDPTPEGSKVRDIINEVLDA